MGNKPNIEALPMLIPQLTRRNPDQPNDEVKLFPTSTEYAILRLLLNLEKIKELLSLREVVEYVVPAQNGKRDKYIDILVDMYNLSQKVCTNNQVHDHAMLEALASKIKSIMKSAGATDKDDPFAQILTLLHYSLNVLAMVKESQGDSKGAGKAVKDVVMRSSFKELSPFDRLAICDYLYSDVYALQSKAGNRGTMKNSLEERFEDVQNYLNSDSDFLDDTNKIPTFYHNVVKQFIFSNTVMPLESEFEQISNAYKQKLFRQLKDQTFNLDFASSTILTSPLISMKYFSLFHNCSVGIVNITPNVSVHTKNIIVQVSFDEGNPIMSRMNIISDVTLNTRKSGLIGVDEARELRSSVGDLIDRVSKFNTAKDYKQDYGFAVVVKKENAYYYTTNKKLYLADLLIGCPDDSLQVFFYNVTEAKNYNEPNSSTPLVVIHNGNKGANKSMISLIVGNANNNFSSISTQIKDTLGLNDTELESSKATTVINGKNMPYSTFKDMKLSNIIKSNFDPNIAEQTGLDPKPVHLAISLTTPEGGGFKEKSNFAWCDHRKSKYNLRIELGRLLSLITKYSFDWKEETSTEVLGQYIRALAPSILVVPMSHLGRIVEIPRKVTLGFLKDQSKNLRVQVPTDYNLSAMIAKTPSGVDYEIYRKSLNNQEVYSFYELEIKNKEEVNRAITDDAKEIFTKNSTLDAIDYSMVKYAVFQQTLST